jgi:hypothetical protein
MFCAKFHSSYKFNFDCTITAYSLIDHNQYISPPPTPNPLFSPNYLLNYSGNILLTLKLNCFTVIIPQIIPESTVRDKNVLTEIRNVQNQYPYTISRCT